MSGVDLSTLTRDERAVYLAACATLANSRIGTDQPHRMRDHAMEAVAAFRASGGLPAQVPAGEPSTAELIRQYGEHWTAHEKETREKALDDAIAILDSVYAQSAGRTRDEALKDAIARIRARKESL